MYNVTRSKSQIIDGQNIEPKCNFASAVFSVTYVRLLPFIVKRFDI